MKKTMFTAILLAMVFALIASCASDGGGGMVYAGLPEGGEKSETMPNRTVPRGPEPVVTPQPQAAPQPDAGRVVLFEVNGVTVSISDDYYILRHSMNITPHTLDLVLYFEDGSIGYRSFDIEGDGSGPYNSRERRFLRLTQNGRIETVRTLQQVEAVAQQQAAAAERAARTVTEDMFQVRQNPNNTITITGYTGDVENVVIPSTLYGLTVTIIGEGAFSRKNIRSVVIPDTVTEIQGSGWMDRGAFGYTSLTSVTLGRGVRTIGVNAFRNNRGLTEIIIPDSVIEIGASAFEKCDLTSLTLGRGLQSIGEEAFQENMLTSVTLPAGLKRIQNDAFAKNRIHTVVIPAGIETVSTSTYSIGVFGGHSITRITLPANLSNTVMAAYGFEESLRNFYANQNRAAGTYVKNGPIWTRQ